MNWTDNAAFHPQPHLLPADSIEITLHLPIGPSTNRLHGKHQGRVYRAPLYERWLKQCDSWLLLKKQYPQKRITGPFEIAIYLSEAYRGDGDNRIKALLDFLQSREIIKNDKDCRKGRWEWVPDDLAPVGCRVTLRSLHTATR